MERALARVRAGEEDPPCRTLRRHPQVGDDLVRAVARPGRSAPCRARIAELRPDAGDRDQALGLSRGRVVPVAKESGARVVIVNAEPTDMDGLADAILRGSISEIVPRLVAEG